MMKSSSTLFNCQADFVQDVASTLIEFPVPNLNESPEVDTILVYRPFPYVNELN
jgi:hypothetical protein